MDMIEQHTPSRIPSTVEIGSDAAAAARAYIEAIVARDPLAAEHGPIYRTAERERLWANFEDRYERLVTGAYAKPPREAVGIALSAI
jgi:hypothetical protein